MSLTYLQIRHQQKFNPTDPLLVKLRRLVTKQQYHPQDQKLKEEINQVSKEYWK